MINYCMSLFYTYNSFRTLNVTCSERLSLPTLSKTFLSVHTLFLCPSWFYFSSWLVSQTYSIYQKPQLECKFSGLGVLFVFCCISVFRNWQVIDTQSLFVKWIQNYREWNTILCCLWKKCALELCLLEFKSQKCHFLAIILWASYLTTLNLRCLWRLRI